MPTKTIAARRAVGIYRGTPSSPLSETFTTTGGWCSSHSVAMTTRWASLRHSGGLRDQATMMTYVEGLSTSSSSAPESGAREAYAEGAALPKDHRDAPRASGDQCGRARSDLRLQSGHHP